METISDSSFQLNIHQHDINNKPLNVNNIIILSLSVGGVNNRYLTACNNTPEANNAILKKDDNVIDNNNPGARINIIQYNASKLRLKHYAAIAVKRCVMIPEGIKESREKISNFSPEEIKWINQWDKLAVQIPDNAYQQYSPSELAVFLGLNTGHYCPLVPTSKIFARQKGRKYLIAYYHLAGYPIWFYPPQLTKEQQSIVDKETGVMIINAGPGTGKTTSVSERAWRWIDEGVIIVSYSNEAIQEIKKHCKKFPGSRGKIGFKKFSTKAGNKYKIVITTIDSLAWRISPSGYAEDNPSSYDEVVNNAITKLRGCTTNWEYKHLIIDEAQDIDKQRGLLVKTLHHSGGFKSLTIFGDPRQRITQSGGWYTDLWETGIFTINYTSDGTEKYAKDYTAEKYSLTISHRFQNIELLNAHNILSSNRHKLHVELEAHSNLQLSKKIRCFNIGHHSNEVGLVDFAQHIKSEYLEKGYNSTDICVIVPSVSSENQTSTKARRLCSVFKSAKINCYTRCEGCFVPNGVLISTIHSVKGKEFKIVILYCMSNFPNYHPTIPSDQADGLIYVANTRAKEEIIYLVNENFTSPRGMEQITFNYQNNTRIALEKELHKPLVPRRWGISEIVSCRGWKTLTYANNYSCIISETTRGPNLPIFDIGNSRLNGVAAGLIVETLIKGSHLDTFSTIASGNYMEIDSERFMKNQRMGLIYNGRWIGDDANYGKLVIMGNQINSLWHTEINTMKQLLKIPLQQLEWKDWLHLVKIYDYIYGGHMNSRYDLIIPECNFPFKEWEEVAMFFVDKFGSGTPETMVKFAFATGACDLLFSDAIIELKYVDKLTDDHRFQLIMYNACLDSPRDMYLYNLKNGVMEKVVSPQHSLMWKYLIEAYCTIKNHQAITINRQNQLGISSNNDPLIFTIDTEFTHSEIFDFALVNLADPFNSIVQPLRTENPFAVEWTIDHNPNWKSSELEELFRLAREIPDLSESFRRLHITEKSCGYYYVADTDAYIPSAYNLKCSDLKHKLTKLAADHGCSMEPTLSVKLGELYDLLVEPLDFQDHLHQHSALTDALLLYDLFQMGHIS